jgi:hypothetical protein
MNNFTDIYPRGVVIDWEQSPTLLHPSGMPDKAQPHAVFWLNKNGIVYKTLLNAINNRNNIPPSSYGQTPPLGFLHSGEKAFYHSGQLSPDYVEHRTDNAALAANYYRVKTIDTPYALPVSTAPGGHSTVWISQSGRAYATRKLALDDKQNNALPVDATGIAGGNSLFSTLPLWLWLLLGILVIMYLLRI